MKKFNTTGVCVSEENYMVDLSSRLEKMKAMVDEEDYFTVNRARQYGKTTILAALSRHLDKEYIVLSLDFQGIGNAAFQTEGKFTKAFARLLMDDHEFNGLPLPMHLVKETRQITEMSEDIVMMDDIFRVIKRWCRESERPVILIIDEVDSATNNQVFLDFLAQLRDGYISRRTKNTPAFHSVILAGVTDVKHLKSKIREEDQHKVNSPLPTHAGETSSERFGRWNIAEDFLVDMSFSPEDIQGMLMDYDSDHHTGMDIKAIAQEIYEYTSGYPFLVSRICQMIDERCVPHIFGSLSEAWTSRGIDEAVKMILSEDNSLFDSLMGKLINYPALSEQLKGILLRGDSIAFLPDDEEQRLLRMYGFIKNEHNTMAVSNRIFEMRLYTYFIGESKKNEPLKQEAAASRSMFVEDGWLNIPLILEHFIESQKQIHGKNDEKFLEEEGRERFLTFLSPIINGTGTYSIEPQTRNHQRMDIVIHYLGRRYIIEVKIWRGPRYNEKGELQIKEYLDYFGLDTGYMLSFNFNKNKTTGVKRVSVEDKVLYEATI